MHIMNGLSGALGLLALLVGGCVSAGPDVGAPGASARRAHAGLPMAFSPRVAGDMRSTNTARAADFVLRPGETLIRAQQGGGRWIYEPNLTADYLDFAAGVRERQGLGQSAAGLTGAGQCVMPFVLPDPVVSEGVILCAFGRVTLEISDLSGNWKSVPVAANGADERIELSTLLSARNHFNIRLTLDADARVSKFRFEALLTTPSTVMLRLDEGVNVMTLHYKDKYGLATVPCEIQPDFRKDAVVPLDKLVAIRHGEVRAGREMWQVIAPKGSDPVQATFTFDAPAGEKFSWFQAHATVAAGVASQKTELAWSSDGDNFQPLAGATGLAGERILDKPGQTVHIYVASDAPITGVTFVGHLDMSAAVSIRPEITHRWMEGEPERQYVVPPGTDKYLFRCVHNPTGHMIELKAPSFRKQE